MLAHGADVNAQVTGAASYSGRIARALTGDPVNTKSNEGMTALHVAVRSRNASLVRYLLDKGARTGHQGCVGKDAARRAQRRAGISARGLCRCGWRRAAQSQCRSCGSGGSGARWRRSRAVRRWRPWRRQSRGGSGNPGHAAGGAAEPVQIAGALRASVCFPPEPPGRAEFWPRPARIGPWLKTQFRSPNAISTPGISMTPERSWPLLLRAGLMPILLRQAH